MSGNLTCCGCGSPDVRHETDDRWRCGRCRFGMTMRDGTLTSLLFLAAERTSSRTRHAKTSGRPKYRPAKRTRQNASEGVSQDGGGQNLTEFEVS